MNLSIVFISDKKEVNDKFRYYKNQSFMIILKLKSISDFKK